MQSSSSVDLSSDTSSSELERQTRNDILVLDKEYNELCDRCDVLDAKHFVLLSQQDATEQTLSHMNQNVELARDGLETLTGQIEERERCSIVQHKCNYTILCNHVNLIRHNLY